MINLDIKEYLQSKLTPDFIISDTRDLDANLQNGDNHIIVITELASNILENSATLPYQFDIYTIDPDYVMNTFKTLSASINNKKFVADNVTYVPFFMTPTPMDRDLSIGTNKYVRLVVFATMNALFNVNDIVSATINDEKFEIMSGTIAYTATLATTKVSGQEVSGNTKQLASVLVNLTFVPTSSSVFMNQLSQLRQGTLSGQTAFNVALTFTNGAVETYSMIVQSHSITSNRGLIPSLAISFAKA